ncbi:SDR family oxidoreductase [Dankookia sp. P2]|uniref:SDR family oxidoreductase n=1 Tax=Dankookia sp. P2 TaxID=3423955 RepID=UPI003D66CA2A
MVEAKAQADGRSFAEREAEALKLVPLRCYVTPEDIANMALYLCSAFGATISGRSLAVGGDMQSLARRGRSGREKYFLPKPHPSLS